MKTVMFAMVALTVIVFAGCRCPMRSERASCPPDMKVITVKVDENQNFIVDNKVLTVEEFFVQSEFVPQSKMVHLDVEPQSAITEETVIRAIRYLESCGYKVAMLNNSKYEHLNDVCKK